MSKSNHLPFNSKLLLLLITLFISFAGHSREATGSSPLAVDQQQDAFTLKGKVSDSNGNPLPGASLVLVGSTRGVVTDLDGSFSI